MRRWIAIELRRLRLHCDGNGLGGCGWSLDINRRDIDAWNDVECPTCGRIVATREGNAKMKKLLRGLDTINLLFGWVGLFGAKPVQLISQRVGIDGEVEVKTRDAR